MKMKLLTALALAGLLFTAGPAIAAGRGGGGGGGGHGFGGGGGHAFGAAFSGGGRSFSGGGRSSYAFSGHGYNSGGRGYYGGRGYGGRYGYRRGGYGYGGGWYYPYYDGYAYPDYGDGYYTPGNTVYGDTEDSDSGSVSAEVQAALAQQGYYHGAVDGVVGPHTHAAIAAYQRAIGLPVTGAIDNGLLQSLGID